MDLTVQAPVRGRRTSSSAVSRIFYLLVFALEESVSGLPVMLATAMKQMRSHPALIPLVVFIGGGAAMSVLYLGRLALKNPAVSWDQKNNPEPWNSIQPNQQYKLFSINMDYSKLKKNGPDF